MHLTLSMQQWELIKAASKRQLEEDLNLGAALSDKGATTIEEEDVDPQNPGPTCLKRSTN